MARDPHSWKFTAAYMALIVADDDDLLDPRPKGLYIATDGDLDTENNAEEPCNNVPVFAGTVLPLSPAKVTEGTTATVYGLY